ncbi:heterogeneous nuclear ribonucleoprotein A3 homolog 2 [Drosophila elegans]|uniref:heterogeneous nuclear ribonucleoprotein A3 homolog 2 n=1 Tax=Drosophila elegans TaxID=30023 RepID=UPI0007E6BBA6|nr:heterogeneous nuclear ribonucleoprotein A3 homolog 2 [Drosophila elegans]
MSNFNRILSVSIVICLALAKLSAVDAQAGTVHWNNGNTAGVGAWSNAQSGGMHPPGSLSGQDPQYSYGYAGIDSRGSYGGAGGNGAYYVSGTDEHGRPFSYGNQAGQPGQPGYMGVRPDPNYPGSYGYQNAAGVISTSMLATLALAIGLTLATTRL